VAVALQQRQLFQKETLKIHEFALKFGVYVCYIVRLNKSDRLGVTVLVQTSHSLENQNIFLNTIAAAADHQPRWTSLVHMHQPYRSAKNHMDALLALWL
jgi:hypothetical protein